MVNGKPLKGDDGRGSRIDGGGVGGQGGTLQESAGRIVSAGGSGGLGFLGQTIVVELTDMSFGEAFQITVARAVAAVRDSKRGEMDWPDQTDQCV